MIDRGQRWLRSTTPLTFAGKGRHLPNQRLTPALLAKAFRGELVSQDPADEPSAELLERLAASRAAAPLKTRKTRQRQPA